MGPKLFHLGFRSKVARATLADANEPHFWRIYADFAQVLIAIARPMYAEDPHSCRLASKPLQHVEKNGNPGFGRFETSANSCEASRSAELTIFGRVTLHSRDAKCRQAI